MPVYDYQCDECKHRFEVRQRFVEEPVTICPSCGGHVRRVYHPVGIVFKGSGFYVTDNRKTTEASSSTSSPETKPSESKTSESKTPASSSGTSESKGAPTSSSTPASLSLLPRLISLLGQLAQGGKERCRLTDEETVGSQGIDRGHGRPFVLVGRMIDTAGRSQLRTIDGSGMITLVCKSSLSAALGFGNVSSFVGSVSGPGEATPCSRLIGPRLEVGRLGRGFRPRASAHG